MTMDNAAEHVPVEDRGTPHRRSTDTTSVTGPVVDVSMDIWSRRYANEGHIWGDEASKTAEDLIDVLDPSSKVLEVGFGYGRDLLHLLQQGHYVYGIEKAVVGLSEATRQAQEYIDLGKAHLILSNFISVDLKQGSFDAVLSHRVLHLLGQNGNIKAFVNRAAGALKQGGLLYVSARDQRDFNPEQMIRQKDGTVTYREDVPKLGDRRGQLISLWDEARFREAFSNKFDIMSIEQGNEAESLTNLDESGQPVQSFFTVMKARKKAGNEPNPKKNLTSKKNGP